MVGKLSDLTACILSSISIVISIVILLSPAPTTDEVIQEYANLYLKEPNVKMLLKNEDITPYIILKDEEGNVIESAATPKGNAKYESRVTTDNKLLIQRSKNVRENNKKHKTIDGRHYIYF